MNANQPAYPTQWFDFQPSTGEQVVRESYHGLTKRELIAAMALQGLLACSYRSGKFSEYAESAVWYTDALLEKLKDTESK